MLKLSRNSRYNALLLFLCALLSLTASQLWADAQRVEKGNLVIQGIPEIPATLAQRYQQYQNTRSASFRGFHPSGEGILISTRFGETPQVHWVKFPGGARQQLTFFAEPVAEVAVIPNPARNSLVLGKDVGGSENFQLYLFNMNQRTPALLTDGRSRNTGAVVSNRGDRLAFTTTVRNGKDWDIHLVDLEKGGASRPLLEKEGFWVAQAWSPDDTRLIVARVVSANETHPFIYELATGKLQPLRETTETVAYSTAEWSHDGRGIYYASDEGTEFQQLRYFDLKTGTHEVLTHDIPWDISQVAVSPDGKWLAFSYNENGIDHFRLLDAATRKDVALPTMPVGQIFGFDFSPDGKRLAMNWNTPQTPGDVYMLEPESQQLTRWTYSEVGGLDTSEFVIPQLIHYETFDQVTGKPRQIPAFYYQPQGKGPWPVVIDIHGGPEGQYRPSFDAEDQFLVRELGIAILAPNVRGSTGYGKSYLKLDDGYLREDSVRDIGKLLDWIATQPELDAARVAVMGGSYGGYMTLAALTHYNDRLRGGIDIVGISNFVTFLENTESYRRDLRRVEYGDERDPEMRAFLQRISPTTNAHKIQRPLFIAQGLNDPRVPASEAEQILAAVSKNGGEPWYFLAKDEGHGFRKKSNRDYFSHAMALFLSRIFEQAPKVLSEPSGEGK